MMPPEARRLGSLRAHLRPERTGSGDRAAPAAAAAGSCARLRLPDSPGVPATRLLPQPEPVSHLLRENVLGQFDRAQYERDGFWVWEGVLTSEGRRQFTESMARLQQIHDHMIMETDWDGIDWSARGLPLPHEGFTSAKYRAQNFVGGAKQEGGKMIPPESRSYMNKVGLFDEGDGRALATPEGVESQGFLPDWCPAAYDPFVLSVACQQPQFQALHAMLLGPDLVLDHMAMLNRRAGNGGAGWHAHDRGVHGIEIEGGLREPDPTFLENSEQVVRTLIYPEGASVVTGGELALVPGSHFYRDCHNRAHGTQGGSDHAALREDWLEGKIHAWTGEPLSIRTIDLPAGSMVSFVHHMLHYVGPRNPASARVGVCCLHTAVRRCRWKGKKALSGCLAARNTGWNGRQEWDGCHQRQRECYAANGNHSSTINQYRGLELLDDIDPL